MGEQARLNFYDVRACGYYRPRQTSPQFGDFAQLASTLLTWVKKADKPLSETSSYVPGADDPFMPTYCLDMWHKGGDFVLVTWNETPTTDGKVGSVDGTQPVGVAQVEQTELPSTSSIPGYPTYFWLLPQQNLLATVQFGDVRNGHQNLDRYFQGFLASYSKNVRYGESGSGSDVHICGYAENAGDEPAHLEPRFASGLHQNPSELDFLRSKRTHIRKIVRNQTLRNKADGHPALWKRMLVRLGIKEPPALPDDIGIVNLSIAPYEGSGCN